MERSDLELFVALYKRFGIELEVSKWNGNKEQVIIIEEDMDNPKLDGYNGFYLAVVFDLDGKFIRQGCFE